MFKISRFLLILILITGWIFSGWPQIWQNPPIPPKVQEAQAATITDTYSTAGSFTWTAPTGITSATVKCWGGGGGGGIAVAGGGGGGGGAYAASTVSVTPGTGYAIVVGAGGLRDTAAGGGDSTFAATVVVADGGLGATLVTGVAGGTVANSTGDVEFAGGTGGTGLTTNDTSGGGGGAGGPAGAGNNGVNAAATVGGVGGSGNAGSGGAGGTAVDGQAGGPGGNHATGGGGGGGADTNIGGGAGGAPGGGGGGSENAASSGLGAAGQCTITYDNLTILGNGASEPSNTTIGPGGSITDLDNFTFQTAATTDTVTAITVTLGPVGAYNNIYQVDITDTLDVAKCTAVTGLTSDTVIFPASTCNIAVTTTQTTYKIRITPKTHANMPAPSVGASYDTTGTVTAFTSSNSQSGSDTGSATITVDNLSPADVTSASGTAGAAQVSLSWTNPVDADYHSAVALRSTSAVADTPVEGTTYIVGNTIGASTVACVVATPTASCIDTGVINGTAYHYKIFTRDNFANYSTPGVVPTGSPFTPVAASLTLIVSTDDFPAGGLTPGTPVFATSTVSVDTNKSTGWYVTLERSDADTTLDLDSDATVNITDQTAWSAPVATTTSGNSYKISSLINSSKVLAFRVMTASSTNGSMFFSPSWWGSADNYIDNASTLWAGVNSTAQKIGISSVSSGGSPALNTVLYYLDVPNTQKTGAYSGNVIFTAVMN